MEAYSYKLKDHQPTPFQKDGKPLSLCFVPSGEMFLTEAENIQEGRATVSNRLRDLLHDFESLPSEALKLFTSNHADISITDALQQNAYGGRDGLHSYLKVENALKDLGVKREHPFSFSGEPLTRETFSEACYGFYGVRLENGFRAMERICGDSSSDKRYEAAMAIYHAVRDLDRTDAAFDEPQKKEILKDAGFHQESKQKALEMAAYSLASSDFDSMECWKLRVAERLANICWPRKSHFEDAIRGIIFPASKPVLSQKEKRLAKDIAHRFPKSPNDTETKANILADLAFGGKDRQKQVALLQPSRDIGQR